MSRKIIAFLATILCLSMVFVSCNISITDNEDADKNSEAESSVSTDAETQAETQTETQAQTEPETTPAESETTPAESETIPAESETTPAESETIPAESETTPAESETTPAESETTPAESETTPAESETTPAESETIPAESETTPAEPETTPAESETTPETDDEIEIEYLDVTIPEALSLEDGKYVSVSGVVTDIDTPWNDNFGNITVTITDADGNDLYVYRLTTNVERGDVITVYGTMATYNGNRQIAQGATATITGRVDLDPIEYMDVNIPDVERLEDGTLVRITATVVFINSEWNDSYKNMNVTLADMNGNTLYVYRLATPVELGDVVIVSGKVDTYNDQKQIGQGSTAVIIGKVEVDVGGTDTEPTETEPTETEPPTYTTVTIPEAVELDDGVYVAVTGTVFDIGTPWNDNFGNISVTIRDAEGYCLYIYKLTTFVERGDVITVYGAMGTYNGARQIGLGGYAEIIGREEIEDQYYPEMTIPEAIELGDNEYVKIIGHVVEVNSAWNDQYNNMNITIADDEGNTLYVYRLATPVEVGQIIAISGKMGTYNGTRQIAEGATAEILSAVETDPVETKPVEPEPPISEPEIIDAVIIEALDFEDGTYVAIPGTVTEINTAWNDNFGNISVTITDVNGDTLYIYRLATRVERGDIIIVTGQMATYNGNRQIGAGATAEIIGREELEEINYQQVTVSEAMGLKDGALVKVTGTVVKIDKAWDTVYGNMSLDILDEEGNTLYIYRLCREVIVGDVITVWGKMATYNGNRQIIEGDAEIIGSNPDFKPTEPSDPETDPESEPVVAPVETETAPVEGETEDISYLPVSLHEAKELEDGTYVTVSGTVVDIDSPWNPNYNNMCLTIADEAGNKLYVYRLSVQVEYGDIITVSGTMATYNGNRQIAQGAVAEVIGKAEISGPEYLDVTVAKALELSDDTYVMITGKVVQINSAWNDAYNNMNVTIEDANGDTLYVYRLSTMVELGNEVIIYGKMGTYNGTRQIAQGATAKLV